MGTNNGKRRHLSPFRYPGGKSWLAPVVRSWLTSDPPKVFLEPFAGGGSMSLLVAAEELARRVVMVELDEKVAAVWTLLIDGSDSDLERLAAVLLAFEPTTENVKGVISSDTSGVVDTAFQAIVTNRCRRGGVMAAGAGLIKTSEQGRGVAGRWCPETLIKRFMLIRSLRDVITFEHGDAFDAIERHGGATMFVDPPYTLAGKRAGMNLYDHHVVDHEELFGAVARNAERSLLTYDDSHEVMRLAKAHGFTVSAVDMWSCHHVRMKELCIWGGCAPDCALSAERVL